MTKKAKLLERVRNSPKDAKFGEVQKLLKEAGFRERQPRGGSSHYIYCHELLDRIVTLTKGTKRLPEYQVYPVRSVHRFQKSSKNKYMHIACAIHKRPYFLIG